MRTDAPRSQSWTVLGAFPQPSCSTPYILEAPYLDYVLDVKTIDRGIGEGYFSFEYANGLYSIGNNGCGCKNDDEDLTAVESCKCAFPVAGQPTKRSIAFEA